MNQPIKPGDRELASKLHYTEGRLSLNDKAQLIANHTSAIDQEGRKLLNVVKSDNNSIYCEDVDGKNWFDAREDFFSRQPDKIGQLGHVTGSSSTLAPTTLERGSK